MKIIFSSSPIHRGCTIEVIFGEEAEGRIPFPIPPSSAMRSATSKS